MLQFGLVPSTAGSSLTGSVTEGTLCRRSHRGIAWVDAIVEERIVARRMVGCRYSPGLEEAAFAHEACCSRRRLLAPVQKPFGTELAAGSLAGLEAADIPATVEAARRLAAAEVAGMLAAVVVADKPAAAELDMQQDWKRPCSETPPEEAAFERCGRSEVAVLELV